MLLLLLPCVLDEFIKPRPLCLATKTHIGQCFGFGLLCYGTSTSPSSSVNTWD